MACDDNRRRPGFGRGLTVGLVGGLMGGLCLGAVLSAGAQDGEAVSAFAKRTLYALGDLAIDTEANAKRIVDLENRVSDLEVKLKDQLGAAD